MLLLTSLLYRASDTSAKKDILFECSLLPAPPPLFSGRLDARPELDTDSETSEVPAEVEDSNTDNVTDVHVVDTVER